MYFLVNSHAETLQFVTGQIGERIEDEKGNMMWLVDFKLDFLNDIDKSGGEWREIKSRNFVLMGGNL